jgi:membrane fusion protein (multidrug efflux system)
MIIAAILLVPTVDYHLNHVITDDAYVSGNLVAVSATLSARVEEMVASTADSVTVGDLIARLEDGVYRADLQRAKAVVAAARSRLAEAEIILDQEKYRAGPLADQYEAELVAARARLAAAQAAHDQSKSVLRRVERLSNSGLVSDSELEAARIDGQRSKARLDEAVELVRKAAAGVKLTDGHLHPVKIQHQRVETERAGLALAEAESERARIQLEDTRILSPVRGVVAKTMVNRGELVDVGRTLAFIRDLDTLWVVANVEETQIRNVAIGQAVHITIDAIPDGEFSGWVEKIGSVTGSQFAIIPRESLGGNFVKVVQRVPVRISVADPDGILKLGLSAVVGIRIGTVDLEP